MKIRVNVTVDVDLKSFADAYGYDSIFVKYKDAREDAVTEAEYALDNWIKRIGFKGHIVNPEFIHVEGDEA